MPDEFPMDKKQARSAQQACTESSRRIQPSQDVAGGRWARGGRRREPAPPAVRRPQQERRPRPRASHHTDAAAPGKTGAGLAPRAPQPEPGSVFLQGSKKQSLNHLLNFHYEPRSSHTSASMQRWPATHHRHKYNKEQFLQANCQFVVSSGGDYAAYLGDPDTLVDWHLVEQIHVQVQEFPSCPICLYPPTAAKMTRCGHVYCWPCLLHYLALSDRSARACPICYEPVHRADLKSVVAVPHSTLAAGDIVHFRLMRRAHDSLLPVPVEEAATPRAALLSVSQTALSTCYSKLLLAGPAEVLTIIERERSELRAQTDDDDRCFVEQALAQLDERERVVLSRGSKPQPGCEDASCGSEVPTAAAKHYYFYQAADGQHLYLHMLNVRMLEHTYGSLEASPTSLSGRILEKKSGSMTEEVRRRQRYLQHMPLTCQFEEAEILLRPPLVLQDTLDLFHEQLEVRRVRRQRRAREEKRREKRIAEEENRQMGRFAEMRVQIKSPDQFPDWVLEPALVKGNPVPSPSSSGPGTGDGSQGLSFAKMLASGRSKPPAWPSLGDRPQEPPPRLISVSGPAGRPVARARHHSDSEPEPEDLVPVPAYRQSFSDAIALALEKASFAESDAPAAAQPTQAGKKKNKRNRQKLLFTTSMIHSGK